jgi:hypothetical protein
MGVTIKNDTGIGLGTKVYFTETGIEITDIMFLDIKIRPEKSNVVIIGLPLDSLEVVCPEVEKK